MLSGTPLYLSPRLPISYCPSRFLRSSSSSNEWMNDRNLYSALKSLQMYAQFTALSRELRRNRCAKEKRSGRESMRSVSICGEVYDGKDLEEVCFKSRVKKRSDWWWQRWWWQCGSDLCRVVRRWKTRMWMRLTERMKDFVPTVGCRMLKRTVCNFERWGSRWSGYGDNRRGSSTARRLNSNQFRKIRRLRGNLLQVLSLIHIWRCRRIERCRSRWSPYH